MKSGIQCLALLAALTQLLVACGKRDNFAARPAAEARAVQVARVEVRPMERVLHVIGTLAAREQATVAAQVAGQIETTLVDVGDRVSAGQELALIDTAAYEALARQSAAAVARAVSSASNAAQNLKRVRELQANKIASASELDQAIAEADQANADVQAAEAADAVARLNLNRSRVKAPFDGAIAERIAGPGDYMSIGTPIVRLVKTDPLRLRLNVPERESVAMRPGLKVRLSIEGDTNVYLGQITRVAPALRESDRMLQVEADVPGHDALRPGLFARAQIVIAEQDQGLSVPPNAVVTFAGLEKVVVIVEGKALEKTVTTGRRADGWIEIVSGLSAGDEVVLEPTGIRTGQPLEIEASAEPESVSSPVTSRSGLNLNRNHSLNLNLQSHCDSGSQIKIEIKS